MKMNPKMILENTNCYGPKIEDTIKKYTLKKNYLKNEDKNKKEQDSGLKCSAWKRPTLSFSLNI